MVGRFPICILAHLEITANTVGVNQDKKNLWKWIGISFVILIIIVALAVVGYKIYRPIRAKELAAQAVMALASDNLDEARNRLRAANALEPDLVEVARATALVWNKLSPTQVAPFWERVVELSGSESSDVRAWAGALISSGELELAREKIDGLLAEDSTNLDNKYMSAVWLQAASRFGDAAVEAIKLVEGDHENVSYWIFYSSLYPYMSVDNRAVLVRRLDGLAKRTDQLGIWALRELLRYSAAREEFDRYAQAVMAHPEFARDDMLSIEFYRFARWGETAYPEIRKRVALYFDPGKLTDRRALARFYRTIGDFQGVLESVTPKQALGDRDSLMLYFDALAGLERWGALLELLDNDSIPLEDYWREIFRARALGSLGRQSESDLAWKRSLLEAGNDPDALSHLAEYLGSMGALEAYSEVMEKLVENIGAPSKSSYYRIWLKVVMQTGDLPRIVALYEKAIEDCPHDNSFLNDYIYYSLLLNRPGTWVIQSYNLVKEAPNVLAYRISLALALFKNKQPAEALSVVKSSRIADWSLVSPGWQCVRAAIYKANGLAAVTISDEDKAMALPEELRLLN